MTYLITYWDFVKGGERESSLTNVNDKYHFRPRSWEEEKRNINHDYAFGGLKGTEGTRVACSYYLVLSCRRPLTDARHADSFFHQMALHCRLNAHLSDVATYWTPRSRIPSVSSRIHSSFGAKQWRNARGNLCVPIWFKGYTAKIAKQ
jgi:hypothetical protein